MPEPERTAAIRAGAATVHRYPAYPELNVAVSALDLADFDPHWVFGGRYSDEALWCLAAFHDAGKE